MLEKANEEKKQEQLKSDLEAQQVAAAKQENIQLQKIEKEKTAKVQTPVKLCM